MAEITTSKKNNLDWRDLGQGALVAFLTALVAGLYQYISVAISTGIALQLPTANDFKVMGGAALFAALGYLLKKLREPAQVIITDSKA